MNPRVRPVRRGAGPGRLVSLWVALASSVVGLAQGDPAAINPGTPWPATDALGRRLPLSAETGPVRSDRWVGIFYFLWHDNRGGKSPHWDGPYDIVRILERDPDALKKPDSPFWGPIGMYHYWGEPLYGYYLSTDPWVLRRHAQLLADAGIDTLIFDTTNAVIYREVFLALCEVFRQVRLEGGRTPQIVFMVNTKAGETAQQIHRELYEKGLYRELWFQWQGKPLMICDPQEASPALRQFFTLRRAHWPFEMVNTPYAWHWEAAYPQPYGYTEDPSQPEQVNVSVAQNLRQSDGKVTNMSSGEARGRAFHAGRMDETPGAVNWGHNFEEQWQRAFALKPPFVMITGWNEWIAGRWGKPDGPLVFVDQFNQDYSRDLEPARVGHRDNYYWQMVANVRRFKGAPRLPPASAPKTIRLNRSFAQWEDVRPGFSDHLGETQPRDYDGAAGQHYANRTGRNDLTDCKVARDGKTVFFYARTREAITPAGAPRGLWLLLDVDQDARTGWEGFDFIVNRAPAEDGKLWLERNRGGWQWTRVAPVPYRVTANELHFAVPRAALGLARGTPGLNLDFKWVDNAREPGDPMDFYVTGDAAPEGRFVYRFSEPGPSR